MVLQSTGSAVSPSSPARVLLVAPSAPPYGGMALQARLLQTLLEADGLSVSFYASNFPISGILSPLNRVPGLRTLVRFALTWPKLWLAVRRVELVHVFAASWLYFFLVVWPAALVGRICRKRVVLNYRGGEAPRFFRRYSWCVRPVFKLADVVSAPSNFLAEEIGRHFGISVAIVPNILDLSAFRYRERREFQPKLLVTRHLEKMYDVETVLRAFRMLVGRYPDASLWIAGTGSQEAHLRGLVDEWGLCNVRFLGFVPHADLPAICNECDVLVNASCVDNFPGALLEASAAGLVVVSTNAGGIPYIYKDGRDAVLVGLRDWKSLAQSVQKVLEQPSLAQDLTKAAAALARNCEWNEVRKHLYAVYGVSPQEQPTKNGEMNASLASLELAVPPAGTDQRASHAAYSQRDGGS
jgi:glycosyltransferase involved in cell wall biosynthesis